MDLYIYYRVDPARATALAGRVRHLQRRLKAETGIAGELARRPLPGSDGLLTWMEVYRDVPDSFAGALERLVAEDGLSGELASARHCETFIALDERPSGCA